MKEIKNNIHSLKDCLLSIQELEQINLYKDILLQWQEHTNLISNNSILQLENRHIIDSLQLIKYIYNKQNQVIFDLGSGAGFPGIVLAIVNKDNRYYLIESNSKKARFLQEVIDKLKLINTVVVNQRIELLDFKLGLPKADVVVSRGLTKLNKLWGMSRKLLKQQGYCLFLKGKTYEEELILLPQNVSRETFCSVTSEEGRIILLKN